MLVDGVVDTLGLVLVAFDPDEGPDDRWRVSLADLDRIRDGWEQWP